MEKSPYATRGIYQRCRNSRKGRCWASAPHLLHSIAFYSTCRICKFIASGTVTKSAYAQAQIDFPNEVCCDLSLLGDALQYQIAVRDDKQGDPAIAEQIAISFHKNAQLAKNYDEITSEYLIDLCKQWLDRLPHRVQPGEKIALKADSDKADGVIQMRCKREAKGRFIEAARKRGQKLTDFMLEAAERLAAETLSHG